MKPTRDFWSHSFADNELYRNGNGLSRLAKEGGKQVLFAINASGDLRRISEIPHAQEFQTWRDRLTPQEYNDIHQHLMDRIDDKDIETSSWIPGAEWKGTVYWPIFEKACSRNVDSAARFFGLIVWDVVMKHPDSWSFGRYELDGTPIEGMTYFRITQR